MISNLESAPKPLTNLESKRKIFSAIQGLKTLTFHVLILRNSSMMYCTIIQKSGGEWDAAKGGFIIGERRFQDNVGRMS